MSYPHLVVRLMAAVYPPQAIPEGTSPAETLRRAHEFSRRSDLHCCIV
ncbi:MAG: hypothetical protein ABI880_02885 [Acidobacteriota bacterium]